MRDFLRNLGLLALLAILMLVFLPQATRQAFDVLGTVLGPALVLVVLALALPRRRGPRR